MNLLAAGNRLTTFIRSCAQTPLDRLDGERAAALILWPLLLSVAVWNGFPLIFYDTGAYLLEGLGLHFLVERSPVYSLFLSLAGASVSLWLIVAIQALATSIVIVECARCAAPRLNIGMFLLLCAALICGTGLPWYVGEVEPDCFAAITALAFYLLAFQRERLGRSRSVFIFCVASFAAATHTSHLLLALGLLLCMVVYAAVRHSSKTAWPRAQIVQPAVALAIAFSLVVGANFIFTGQIFLSRAGPAFVFARLLQDRIVGRLLDETCPASQYRLCAYRDVLPPTANAWLWASYSPFFKLGGFEGTSAESSRIIRDSLLRYPLMNAEAAAADSAKQFFSFKTGDQVEPQQWAILHSIRAFLPSQAGEYLSARQQRASVGFKFVNFVHVPVGYLSLAGLTVFLAFALWSADGEAGVFLGTIMLALMGNAVICGALSNPHDRYQSRLVWIATLAMGLVACARAASWRPALRRLWGQAAAFPAQVSRLWLRKRLAGADRIRH
ncbi:MAG: hypothetical protein ABSD74_20365 [Rhizomicrobium sp.]|jgi:hypothetical protein